MIYFIGLISSVIFFYILYLVIKWAIDNSQTAENINDIRHILSTLHPEINVDEDEENIEEEVTKLISDDKCPACGSDVSPGDAVCPSCGLTLN